MKLIYAFLALIGLLTLGSCTKEQFNQEKAKLYLSAHRWKLSSTVMVTGSGEQAQVVPECKKDNLWEYKYDGSFALYPGSNLCSSSENTMYGNWELTEGLDGLTITIPGVGAYTDEVVEIQPGKLKVRYTTDNVYIDTYVAN